MRSQMGCYNNDQIMELRRMRWLDKLAKMETNRFSQKFLNAWTNNPRITGYPQKQQSMENAKISKTLTYTHMNELINLAEKGWGNLVEWKQGLVPGTYVPFESRNG